MFNKDFLRNVGFSALPLHDDCLMIRYVCFQVLRLQTDIEQLHTEYEGRRVTLQDICFQPMAPDNNNCTIMSLLNYFQNDEAKLNATLEDPEFFDIYDYMTHITACIQ